MKIYTVLTTVIEIEVPEKEWDDIDFNNADTLAGKSLMEMIVLNGFGGLNYRHFKDEEDALDQVGEP